MNPFENIEQYMANGLSNADKVLFEKAIQQDPSLKRLVDNYDDARKVSEHILEAQLLQEVKLATKPKQKSPFFPLGKWIGIAASILILIAIGFIAYNKINFLPKAEQELVLAEFFIKKPIDAELYRSELATPKPGTTAEAKSSYLHNNYKTSVKQFEKILANAPETMAKDTINYWLAQCHVKLGKYRKALNLYTKTNYDRAACHAQLCRAILRQIPKNEIAPSCKK